MQLIHVCGRTKKYILIANWFLTKNPLQIKYYNPKTKIKLHQICI